MLGRLAVEGGRRGPGSARRHWLLHVLKRKPGGATRLPITTPRPTLPATLSNMLSG